MRETKYGRRRFFSNHPLSLQDDRSINKISRFREQFQMYLYQTFLPIFNLLTILSQVCQLYVTMSLCSQFVCKQRSNCQMLSLQVVVVGGESVCKPITESSFLLHKSGQSSISLTPRKLLNKNSVFSFSQSGMLCINWPHTGGKQEVSIMGNT